jgi:hypothetical protein
MTKSQLTANYQKEKASIQNNPRLTQVEKDVQVFRKWRIYINEHSLETIKQESADITVTTKTN